MVHTAQSALAQFVLVTLLALVQAGSPVPTYQWVDSVSGETVTCRQCPPGTSVSMHCTSRSQTRCQQCPHRHYTHYWNYLDRCRFCNVFCEEWERVKHECNSTHNRVCECQPGYHRGAHFCIPHRRCGPGQWASRLGTEETDTECAKCPPGTFSDQLSSSTFQKCKPHRDCSAEGKEINVPGTAYHNTLCIRCQGHYNLSTLNPDCEQDILDFMTHQYLSPRHIRRLEHIVKGLPLRNKRLKNPSKLLAIVIAVRNFQPNDPLLPTLLEVLNKARLIGLEKRLRRHFLLKDHSGTPPGDVQDHRDDSALLPGI